MNSQSKLHILFTRDEIEATVKRLAAEISEDYHGKHPVLIGVLKGSFMFMADLIRLLDLPRWKWSLSDCPAMVGVR